MHLPMPFAAVTKAVRRTYGYFTSGIAVEGRAWLCESGHPLIWMSGTPWPQRPQHIDVELLLWNRRGDPVAVLEIAEARILSRTVKLAPATWDPFEEVELKPGAPRTQSDFVLVPADAPDGRVEVALGEVLRLRLRPSRGSKRWGWPEADLRLGLPSES